MEGMVANPKLLFYHLGYPRLRPDIAAKSEGFGALSEQGVELLVLLCTQAWDRPFGLALLEGLGARLLGSLDPLADGSASHTKRAGDVGLFPPGLEQLPGAKASIFFLILAQRHRSVGFHTCVVL